MRPRTGRTPSDIKGEQYSNLGEKKYAMRIWLDPAKLSAYSLTALDIQQALSRENVELPRKIAAMRRSLP